MLSDGTWARSQIKKQITDMISSCNSLVILSLAGTTWSVNSNLIKMGGGRELTLSCSLVAHRSGDGSSSGRFRKCCIFEKSLLYLELVIVPDSNSIPTTFPERKKQQSLLCSQKTASITEAGPITAIIQQQSDK